MLSLQRAWNVFGAPTKLASAEERVAAKMPPVTIGPQAEIFSITCKKEYFIIRGLISMYKHLSVSQLPPKRH